VFVPTVLPQADCARRWHPGHLRRCL